MILEATPMLQTLTLQALSLQAVGWTGYAVLAGVLTFWIVVWPEGSSDRRLVGLAVAGTALLALATLGDPLLRLTSGGESLAEVLDPVAASALLVRLAALSAAAFFLPDLLRRPVRGARQALAGLLVVLLTAGVLADELDTSGGWASVGLVAGITHALSAAAWVGGLVALTALLLTRGGAGGASGPVDVDALLGPFAALATGSLALLLLSGITRALVEAGGVGALLTSQFGLVVLLKAVLLTLMLLLGRRARAHVAADPEQPRRASTLRLVVLGEVGLAAGALAATALLVAAAPA